MGDGPLCSGCRWLLRRSLASAELLGLRRTDGVKAPIADRREPDWL